VHLCYGMLGCLPFISGFTDFGSRPGLVAEVCCVSCFLSRQASRSVWFLDLEGVQPCFWVAVLEAFAGSFSVGD
jgi:hypothetical protein